MEPRTAAQTPRLALRRALTADAPFLLRLLNEPSWIRNIGDRGIRTVADAERYLREKIWAQYDDAGFGMHVIELRDGGAAAGLCGLVRRDTLPGPDIGFALLPEHEGRGLAAEAAGAAMRLAADQGIARLHAIVMPSNARSLRLLERLGFRDTGTHRTPQGEELRLYAVDLAPRR
ncbi:MAG TPA: GNAT family N-acetyltransferase [Candidatus Binatia bacterium]|nr:GNAT family N-acetyltransferase [Candidatus Binatia bacterium]